MRSHYDVVNFLPSPQNWHPIAHPSGWDMRYLLGFQDQILSSALIIGVLYVISWYNGPCCNGTWLLEAELSICASVKRSSFRLWLITHSAPSHYLNRCWYLSSWIFENKFQWNFNQNKIIFTHKNELENVVCEMAAILSQGQWVK